MSHDNVNYDHVLTGTLPFDAGATCKGELLTFPVDVPHKGRYIKFTMVSAYGIAGLNYMDWKSKSK